MFIINWFFNVLSWLGLYNKSGKILFLGLDNAGKTTLLHMLKNEKLGAYEPTQKPNCEELVMGNINFKTIDLGGHELARRLWKEYFTDDVSAVVFLVDAAEPQRFGEAKRELDQLLASEQLSKVPFLILGNKIDITHKAVSEQTLKIQLGIDGLTTGKETKDTKGVRPIEVFMCSIKEQIGYRDGFLWMSQYIE